MKENSERTVKWLKVLMVIAIVSLVNSFLSIQPFFPLGITTWISRALMLAMAISMIKMAPIHPRYQKAGIYRCAMLALTLIAAFIFASSFLTIAASVLSIMAVYQEYSAHSELVDEFDPKLSQKWHSLFNWGIVAAVLVGFASFVAAMLAVMMQFDSLNMSAVIVGILSIPQFIIDVIYLRYIGKMIGYFEGREEV